MRRLICFLGVCLLSACTSTRSDVAQEMTDNPPSTAAPGKVAIWASSAAPLVPEWSRVKTWIASVTSCTRGATGPEINAITDDGLPVVIQVFQPSGQEARLAATIQYAPDGSSPRRDGNDEQLLIVSDQTYSHQQTGENGEASFSGGFVHAPGKRATAIGIEWHTRACLLAVRLVPSIFMRASAGH